MKVDIVSAGGGGSSSNASVGSNGSTAPTASTEIGYVDGTGNLQQVTALKPLPVTDSAAEASLALIQAQTVPDLISTVNSSTSPLTANSTFTGAFEDMSAYAEVRILVYSDQASSSNGLILQYSSDGTNVDAVDQYTTTAAIGIQVGAGAGARYFRVVFTNGGVSQTAFRLQTIYKKFRTKPSSQRQQDGYTNQTDLEQVWNFNSVWNGTTWDRLPGSTAGGASVTVLSSALPAGGATSALQTTTNTILTNGTQVSVLAAGTANIGHIDGQGTAGTPSGGVVSVQGVSGGTSVPVSIAGTVTTTDAANGPVTPGTVATKSELMGGQFNTSLPTLTTGQQAAVQLDASGRQIVAQATASALNVTDATGVAIQGTVAAGTAATKSALTGGVFNTSLPTLTTGQQAAIQLDASGRQIIAQATASALNATVSIAAAQTLTTVTTVGAVTAITNALPAGTNAIGKQAGFTTSAVPVQNIYSTTSITTAAFVQLVASTTSATQWIDIFDSSGQAMILATGGSGSEVAIAYIPPGGDSFSYSIPASTRISMKALSANATTGYLLLNLRG